MEWLNANIEYWHWIVLGLILCGFEMIMPSFFMLWLGVSALVVGILVTLVDISFTSQLFIWTALSFACLVTWFKFISPRMKDKTLSGMGREALLGQNGTIIEHNTVTFRGRMKFPAPLLGSDEWDIISQDELKPGDRVQVVDLKGNALLVKK